MTPTTRRDAERDAERDQRQVRDLVGRYAHAVDDRDVDRVVACFVADGTFESDEGPPVCGHDALHQFFTGALAGPRLGRTGSSTHLMANVLIDVADDGATATVATEAVAFLAAVGRDTIAIRGLRYRDRCVRTPTGWCFATRRHHLLWECSAPGGVAARAGVSVTTSRPHPADERP